MGAIECLEDLTLDLVDGLCAVNGPQQPALGVVVYDLRQAILVDVYSSARHSCPIIASTALAATRDDAPDELVGGNIEVQRSADRAMMFLQPRIERMHLRERAREPLDNRSTGSVRLPESLEHKVSHEVIWHQPAAGHQVLVRSAIACA